MTAELPNWQTALNKSFHQLGLSSYDREAHRWLAEQADITITFAWDILTRGGRPSQKQAESIVAAYRRLLESLKERIPVSVSAAVLIENANGQLLLVKQKGGKPKWGPPAGGMIANETPLQTALRETQEEIGIQPRVFGIVGVYTNPSQDRTEIGFVFRGQIPEGSSLIPNQTEIENARFFSPSEIETLIQSGQIYRPDFNLRAFSDWKQGMGFPLQVVREGNF